MKKGELHDILYRLTISLSDKNKLYNFFKQFIDLFKGDKIDEKYLPESNIKLKTINGEDIKGEGNIIINKGVPTMGAGTGSGSEIFNSTPDYPAEASGIRSHAEGLRGRATGHSSHAEGYRCYAEGDYTHAEGHMTTATGQASHAEGYETVAICNASHVEGKYNTGQYNSIHEVGIGTNAIHKDAHRITTDGKHYILNIGGFDGLKAATEFTTEKDLATIINEFETRIAALEAKQTT